MFWAGALIAMMLIPGVHVPNIEIKFFDKLVHFISYGIFTFLLLKGFDEMPEVKNYFLLAAVISIGYGTILELFQAIVPDRTVDWLDLTANTLGCIATLIIFPLVVKGE